MNDHSFQHSFLFAFVKINFKSNPSRLIELRVILSIRLAKEIAVQSFKTLRGFDSVDNLVSDGATGSVKIITSISLNSRRLLRR